MILSLRIVPSIYRSNMNQFAVLQSILRLGSFLPRAIMVTHWGRVMHIYVSKISIIHSDNGLSPAGRHANIYPSAGILLIKALGINISGILIEINIFPLKKCIRKLRLQNGVYFVSAWNLTSLRTAVCLQTYRSCSTNAGPASGKNSLNRNERIVRPGKSNNGFIHEI